MVDMLGGNMTVIQFFNTINFPMAVWVILFAIIFFKFCDIGKK